MKYLRNFWRTLEMPLIYCEINLTLTLSANYLRFNAAVNQATTSAITDTKLYVPVVTSTKPIFIFFIDPNRIGNRRYYLPTIK